MGGGGSSGYRLGRDFAGGSSHRPFAPHDHGWAEGVGAFGGLSLRHACGLRVGGAGH
jgi:hypothetical protein